jgi:hypothetical protein
MQHTVILRPSPHQHEEQSMSNRNYCKTDEPSASKSLPGQRHEPGYLESERAHSVTPSRNVGGATWRARQNRESAAKLVSSRISGRPRDKDKHIATVDIYRSDTVVRRKNGDITTKAARTGGGRRDVITELTRASRNALRFQLRNGPPIRFLATFTYGATFPTDASTIKKHTAGLRRWLTSHNLSGIWVREFQSRGAAHLHIVFPAHVDAVQLTEVWARITSTEEGETGLVHVERISHQYKLINYISKITDQKKFPESIQGLGRWWAAFGGYRAVPVRQLLGTESEVAPMIRTAVRLATAKRPHWLPPVRNTGKYRLTLYSASKGLLHHFGALIRLLGIPPGCVTSLERPPVPTDRHRVGEGKSDRRNP